MPRRDEGSHRDRSPRLPARDGDAGGDARLARRRLRLGVVVAAAALAAPACGGGTQSGGYTDDPAQPCNDRRVEYVVAGGFAGPEAGVSITCAPSGPRVVKYRLVGDAMEREQEVTRLSNREFEALWEKIEATGWRHLDEECDNPTGADTDPIYTIEVADHALMRAYECTGRADELPFPYDRIVNELDLKAAAF